MTGYQEILTDPSYMAQIVTFTFPHIGNTGVNLQDTEQFGREGGAPGLVHQNTDGSADLGLMQVNTLWVPVVARALGASEDTVRTHLVDDGCFSIRIAGAILWEYRRARRGDLMMAIGDYHSHTPPLNQAYQAQVVARARARFEGK